ncbi:lycopene cyclase domain-containing protein [Natronocalculus amylovorans]|uniref:Lycopene cyclase domain-containing protein n=1 Tax=Natronocalculus amylovorans TaxID=2917812 RepID=A0AAE3FVL4_9EURY|nr:lycopene cyclase domain-containing protein [Natronocalculus amylovorans]MCL9815970.1 lycopene cyclase domain-containing protein [Natronocalculus amylovorans]
MVELTYLQFHAVFILPVIGLLLFLLYRNDRTGAIRGAIGISILVTIAFIYTTPWGSYMIQRGVWWYGDGAVVATVLSIPLGEYLFFIFQTVIVGLYLYLRGFDPTFRAGDFAWRPRLLGVGAGFILFVSGIWLVFQDPSYLYLGGLIAWVGPVIMLQWAVGGGYLIRTPRIWLEAALVPALYLWVTDRIAIEIGTWVISEQYTTGIAVLGLPIEEMLFFFVAGLMTVNGLVLFEWVLDYWDTYGWPAPIATILPTVETPPTATQAADTVDEQLNNQ